MVPLLPRGHSDNVLNISLIKIPTQAHTGSLLVKSFFNSLVQEDFNNSKQVVEKLKNRANKLKTQQCINEYYSCLNILVSRLLSRKDSLRVHDLKILIDGYDSLHDHKYDREIKQKLIECLVYSYGNAKGKHLKSSISIYIKKISEKWGIDMPDGFVSTYETNFDDELPGTLKLEKMSDLPSIECFLRNGLLNFEGLCSYIASRFDKFDDPDRKGVKLYELFKMLDDKEKLSFMEEYTKFNLQKELDVEAHSLNMAEDFSSKNAHLVGVLKLKHSHENLLYLWYEQNVKALKELIEKLSSNSAVLSSEEKFLGQYIFYLQCLPAETLISLIISRIFSETLVSESGYSRVLRLAKTIGYSFKSILIRSDRNKEAKLALQDFFHEEEAIKLFASLIHLCIANCKIPKKLVDSARIEELIQLLKGESLTSTTFVPDQNEMIPAFVWEAVTSEKKYKKLGVLKIHPYFLFEFKNYKSLASFKSLYLPMLCPPKSWSSPEDGGYLKNLKSIVSSNDLSSTLFFLNQAHKVGQLNSVYAGLDYLGNTAWSVNLTVFNIINAVMETGAEFLKVPPDVSRIPQDFPEKPNPHDYANTDDYTRAQKEYLRKCYEVKQEFHAIKALRASLHQTLRIAKAFETNGDMFFFPHNLDFRGRAYPMTSVLNHHHDDMERALLMFWHGKPLGDKGLNWLKYQLAGLFGKDKYSMKDRLLFVDKNMPHILDSAQNPLSGTMWWKTAEKPWQTLALCIELYKIQEFCGTGKREEDYVCHIPIHQDGSCNGFQHYAALGADEDGANAVNVIPIDSDKQVKQDVYSKVSDLVKIQLQKDMSSSSEELREFSRISLPILSRKLVKQSVMTSVYGVTRFGATAQVNERIKEIIKNIKIGSHEGRNSLSTNELEALESKRTKIASYLALQVLTSVNKLFSGARMIQDWLLINTLRVITSHDLETINQLRETGVEREYDFFSSHYYKPMMWTSISGFPIVQLYKHTKQKVIKTLLQQIVINKPSKTAIIDVRKQLDGIAPNFIHSIDSIHLLMTSLSARTNNITFAAVHDSFWTLPCDVDRISRLIREEFVNLHSSNIMENFRDDLIHSCRHSFQLAYVKNIECPEFVQKLNELRSDILSSHISSKKNYNTILLRELSELSQCEKNPIMDLIARYKPRFYAQWSRNRNSLKVYKQQNEVSETFVLDKKEYTPVLIPVEILDLPDTGKMDISKVLDSIYFFS